MKKLWTRNPGDFAVCNIVNYFKLEIIFTLKKETILLPLKIYSPRTKSLELFTSLVVDYKIFIDRCRDLLPYWHLAIL